MADTFITQINREGVTDYLVNTTSNITEGAATNGSGVLELRIRQGASITQLDVVHFMEKMLEWILEGGQLTLGQAGDSALPSQ